MNSSLQKSPQILKEKSIFKDMLNGATSGLVTILFMQPFQVVNTSMVIHFKKEAKIGMIETIKRIYNNEKIWGFYRGFTPAVLKSLSGSAMFFGVLESTKRKIKKSENQSTLLISDSLKNFLCSGFARFVQITSVNPIIVIKTRSEVIGFNHYSNFFEAIKTIKNKEGLKGFYAGLNVNLIKEVPASALFYALYEFTKLQVKLFGIENKQLQASIASVFTSNFIVILTNPLDVIRMRQQYQFYTQNNDHKYKNIFHGLGLLWRTEGIRGMFLGIMPKFLKKGFQNILVWTTYESLK